MSDLFADYRETVDRTELEAWSICPWQARDSEDARASGKARIVGTAAVVGEQGHKPIGNTIADLVSSRTSWSKRDIVDQLLLNLSGARPDVQSRTLEAFRPAVWAIAEHLAGLHPDDVMHFDGGEGDLCGQLGADIGEIRATTEFDLLHATRSKEVLCDCDWKGGWRFFDVDTVYHSFQFQEHAAIAFANYPECECLEVRVLNCRLGKWVRPVQFERRDVTTFNARIIETSTIRAQYVRAPVEDVPVWPSVEKCRICDCASRCPAATRSLGESPESKLDRLVAVEAIADSLRKELAAVSDKTGHRIESRSGARAGRDKPSGRKPTFNVWSEKSGGDEE